MMGRCAGIKRDGTRCTVGVPPGVEWCFNHDPSKADERRRNASRAGRGSGSREIRDLKTDLATLAAEVRRGEIATGTAVVLVQIGNARLRCIEAERKIREQDEILAEIDRIKDALAS